MQVIDWVIFGLGISFSLVVYFQRKAIQQHKKEKTESLGLVLLLLAYLEAQARMARDKKP